MKNSFYILIFFPFLMMGQSNSTDSKVSKTVAIESQFSKPVVLAFQNQAINTIKDFYNYINLYRETEHSSALEKEIDKSIQNLFLNTTVSLKDIFNETDKSITLNQFLTQCKEKFVSILVSDFEENNIISDTFFTFQYKINATINNKTTTYTINQKVYFFPSEKQFGTQTKNVWQLKLGEF